MLLFCLACVSAVELCKKKKLNSLRFAHPQQAGRQADSHTVTHGVMHLYAAALHSHVISPDCVIVLLLVFVFFIIIIIIIAITIIMNSLFSFFLSSLLVSLKIFVHLTTGFRFAAACLLYQNNSFFFSSEMMKLKTQMKKKENEWWWWWWWWWWCCCSFIALHCIARCDMSFHLLNIWNVKYFSNEFLSSLFLSWFLSFITCA